MFRKLLHAIWELYKFIWSSIIVAFIVQFAAAMGSTDMKQFLTNLRTVIYLIPPWLWEALFIFIITTPLFALLEILKEEPVYNVRQVP